MMTNRERILALLDGKTPDRIPWIGRLEQWYLELKKEGKLPEGIAGQYLGGAVKAWQDKAIDIIFRGAPHLLVASAPQDSPSPAQDTLIALTTFQLMAHARGIGTVWNGMFMMVLSVMPELSARYHDLVFGTHRLYEKLYSDRLFTKRSRD